MSTTITKDQQVNIDVKDEMHLMLDRLELPNMSKRIYYTCIDVCKELVACGANTGSVYLFKRVNIFNTNHKLVLVETTASLGEPVTNVAFSPDGQNVALSQHVERESTMTAVGDLLRVCF